MHNYYDIKIAFYKGNNGWHHFFIKWWTNSKYSHTELLLDGKKIWTSISPFGLSSVESRVIENINIEEWDFIDLRLTKEQMSSLIDFIVKTTGNKYDWIGMIFSQIFPFILKSKNKWYCSSWVAHALLVSGVINPVECNIFETPDLHPGKLYDILLNHKKLIERSKI